MSLLEKMQASPFYQSSLKFQKQLQQIKEEGTKPAKRRIWELQKINLFPLTSFITCGDSFFKKLWELIDQSKQYFWITTYAIDSSPAADTTLLKLIQAQKRGVHVVLLADNVQFWAKKELIQEFESAGGTFKILNPQFKYESIKRYMDKDVWRRHHQKLIVTDNKGIIGSANIEGAYAGIKYGTSIFQDLNYYTQNIILDQYRKHFTDVANFYNFRLDQKKSNQALLEELGRRFPNSTFYDPEKYTLLHNDLATGRREIEDYVISHVKEVERQIKIIQPYHYPMLKFDRELIAARKKGVQTDIITAGRRDQPVFKSIFNYMLFQRLIRKGVTVYETTERMLHSKVYLFDGKYMTLGSMNNDRWSWKINNEVNIGIHDQRDCEFVESYFQQMLKRTRKVTKDYTISSSRALAISFWQKFLYLSEIVMNPHEEPEEKYVDSNQKHGHEILEVEVSLEEQVPSKN